MNERVRANADDRISDQGDGDDKISLKPYLETIWCYRSIVAASMVIAAAAFTIAVLGVWLWFPRERIASLRFRLMFNGAAHGTYPNGSPFSPAEIVDAPIVTYVFTQNDLQRYGSYEDFKAGLFVERSSLEMEHLMSDYAVRLSDPKLGAVDRVKFESEFASRRESIVDPSYALSLRSSERFRRLPPQLGQKVLTELLSHWAQEAEVRKGVLKANVTILSNKLISHESLDNDDYLIAADSLRAKAIRILRTIDELEKLPGSMTFRAGKDKTSLAEIRAVLEDCVRFELEPLLGMIRSEGITKNARQLALYASNMVFQLKLDKKEIENWAEALRVALREYSSPGASYATTATARATTPPSGGTRPGGVDGSTSAPQMSEAFLDRMEKMYAVSQKGELEYRRKLTDQVIMESRQAATYDKDLAYYEDLAQATRGSGDRASGSPELIKLIKERSLNAFELISKSTSDLSSFYQELSTLNLGAAARLYTITTPYAEKIAQSLSPKAVAVAFALVMMMTLVLVPIGCLIHHALTRPAAADARQVQPE